VFSFERSADLMLVLVIGGTGYLYGGLIGAVVFKMLQDVFSNLTPQYWQFWIGLVLVVIVLIGRAPASLGAVGAEPVIAQFGPQGVAAVPEATRHDDSRWKPKGWKSSSAASRSPAICRCDREGRAPRADRPERRRQDHRDQSADRRAQANAGRILLEGRDITELPVA
jgi:hypothetical protein